METGHYLARPLPRELAGLGDLALDLRWSWNHGADALWEAVDAELWEATRNPWLILESVSSDRLTTLAGDAGFRNELQRQLEERDRYLNERSWFAESGPPELGTTVAYFSMEFGLAEALPIYSGGLGILAGDLLKTASDLGVPVIGVGLLYQQGYFRQALDANGEQLAFFPYNDPTMLPVVPLRDETGAWVHVHVELPGRDLRLRGWEAHVGRARLLLLDSNDPLNLPSDRGITGELYGGGSEMRLQQELVLGIGGWRLLEEVSIDCAVCHLNEGHAAFAVLERARSFQKRTGQPFRAALRCTRAGNLFTTHTPVAAGFDRFAPELVAQYLQPYAASLGVDVESLLALGRVEPHDAAAPFNMAVLALRGSGSVNGVSRLHGAVSRRLFQPLFARWPEAEVPIGHVTNGVHMPTWDSAAADDLWTRAGGKGRWLGSTEALEESLRRIPDADLWSMRGRGRQALIASLRTRVARQRAGRGATPEYVAACAHLLDPNVLTIGFARRFASYKRPTLLLHDPQRLRRLLANPERPVQLLVAGKAHPQDEAGRRLVRAWSDFVRQPQVCERAVFLEDYDIGLAAELVQGVDLWINTPRRPWEASGTSGMKLLVNGGVNLSELDGWWAEAYAPDVGFALGDGCEHDADPAWDAAEADQLYRILEQEVVPAFYDRDPHGIPTRWVARVRESMAHLTPRFSTNRMLREYLEQGYVPAAAAYRRRADDKGRLGAELETWAEGLRAHWTRVRIAPVDVESTTGRHRFRVQAYLDELEPDAVAVELYAEAAAGRGAARVPMQRGEALAGAVHGYVYTAEVPDDRPASHYTPRIVPFHPEAAIPLEAAQILWPH